MTQRMILISTNHPHLRFASKDVLRTLQCVYQGEKEKIPTLAVVFTYNSFIRKINKKFLNHDRVTDVMTFYLGQDGGIESEIYINLDAAKKQAQEYSVKFTMEVRRLIIHGILHMLGYQDKTSKGKKGMVERENFYLSMIG
jgi:rRNA maturation RNase YbeY